MGRRMARRAPVAAAASAAVVFSLTGCLGGSGDAPSGTAVLPADVALVKASQQTGRADTFEAELTITDTGEPGSVIRGSGDVRLRPDLAFSVTLGEVRLSGQSLPGTGVQAILTDGTLYAKVPRLAQMITGGKPWLRVNVDAAGRVVGFGFDELTDAVRRINPAEQTKMLTASKDVRRVGEEEVEGVKTVHYAGTVTVQDALDRLDPVARERIGRWYTASGSDRLSFDVWVDAADLPRKLVVKGTADGRDTSTMTVLYRDYGDAVTVNPPPADQVGDVTDRIGQFLRGR